MKVSALNRSAKVAVSRLFASSIFRELATSGKSSAFARLIRDSNLSESPAPDFRVRDAFDVAFAALRAIGNRDEYIYKAALTHNILLGTHSLKTACMLTEFRVGECKADVAILNGTSTVYEIKSERDSLVRLKRQVEAYKKVFARVYVIVGESHVEDVLDSTENDVGVLALSARQRISTLRDARECIDRICPLAVFESIRTHEAKSILKMLRILVPDVPNTVMRAELEPMFARLSPTQVHTGLVATLKKTRNLSPLAKLVDDLPFSLTPAALTVPLKKADHQRLLFALDTRLRDAMSWGRGNVLSIFPGQAV